MVKILIATHGTLSEALKDTAGMFFGDVDGIETLSLKPQDNPAELKDRIIEKIKDIYDEDGVLVFVDLFAGTPCNTIAMVMFEMQEYKIECITGANLPLVMEALSAQSSKNLIELKEYLISISSESILDLKERLGM